MFAVKKEKEQAGKHRAANGPIGMQFKASFVRLINHECTWNNEGVSSNKDTAQYHLKVSTIDTKQEGI